MAMVRLHLAPLASLPHPPTLQPEGDSVAKPAFSTPSAEIERWNGSWPRGYSAKTWADWKIHRGGAEWNASLNSPEE